MCAYVGASAGKVGLVGGEQLVGYFLHTPSRRGLLSGLAVIGTVCSASQWLAKSVCISSRWHG